MKIQVLNILGAYTALKAILNYNDIKFDISWKIQDILNVLEPHTKRYEQENHKLLQKYGNCTDEAKGVFEVAPDKVQDYYKEAGEMNKHELEIEINLLDKSDFNGLTIPKGTDLSTLKDFFKQ